jgi:ATP-binding cassette subfamily F protein 3
LISVRGLTLRRGPEPLLQDTSFTIFRGEKIGLTGANGAGKSSLLAALRATLTPDLGEVPANLSIAHVEQEILATTRSAIEYVLDGDKTLRDIETRLAAAEHAGSGALIAELHNELHAHEAYRSNARAATILHGLGFSDTDLAKQVGEFSGGWRVRLAIARALASRADLLLLDEPTNHLDLDAVLWLEEWLAAHSGTIVMVSHDRDFLDAIVNRILQIEERRVESFTGNYSDFEQQRAQRLAQHQASYSRQQKQIAEISAFISRFKAKATKARQAQSRMKMLERMQRIAPAHVDSPFEFKFAPPLRTPRPLISLEDAAVGYGLKPVVSGLNLSIAPGDRIALLGPNGAGKSTFTKLIAGLLQPASGRRVEAADVVVGYFAQHRLEQLIAGANSCVHMREFGGEEWRAASPERVREHLGHFGFRGERAFDPVGNFSGGEKARLSLALLVAQRPNLLLLDEPTNHLDLEMRHALGVALQGYEGALLLVSHDRHLINSVADTLWLVADGRAGPFDGDLADYQRWLKERRSSPQPTDRQPHDRKAQRRREAEERSRLTGMRRQLGRMEKELAERQAECAALDAELADPEIYVLNKPKELRLRLGTRAKLLEQIAQLESAWLDLSEQMEAAAK